jgi:xanthine/uracil/vitamin C permease (AzgA family)
MNIRTIIASSGLAMLSLSAVSIIGLSSGSSVQAQSPQSNQNSNTTAPIVYNATIDDIKQQLHAQLDGAIMAAQNNDTFGVLMGLGQITEALAAINTPGYFLFEGPLPNNATTLANTSETTATGSNQGTTTTTTSTTSAASPNN